MNELADIAAGYFKIPVPEEDTQCTHDPQEEDVEDADAAANQISAKNEFIARQFKLASSSLAPSESDVDEHMNALEKVRESTNLFQIPSPPVTSLPSKSPLARTPYFERIVLNTS